jgi:DNA-binding GntR family transcriptional regulator
MRTIGGKSMRQKTKPILIAEDIQRRIAEGEFKRGQRIPTQRVMVKEYKTSSRTVSEAVDILKARQIVVTDPGNGAYVK